MCFEDLAYKADTYTCFYSNGNKILTYLDNKFIGLLEGYNYEEYHIPALIDGEVLDRCGYFESFPHHLTSAAFVKESCYKDVVSEKAVKKEHIEICNKYLTPAACLHIYPMFEGKKIKDNTIITTKARVYRYEAGRFEDLTRLWDFTVRELVFIGDSEFVKNELNNIKQEALKLALNITSDAKISRATDSFYPNKQNEIKSKIQKVNALKSELLIPIKGKDVAVASFNFHEFHFSKPFYFDNDNKIVTGCVGFGLERWVAACIEYEFKI